MARNRSDIKATPPFVSDATVEELYRFIDTHGLYARILQARRCPCAGKNGSPDMHCSLCQGDGFFTVYQKRLLQLDEDITGQGDATDPSIVYPFFQPIAKPVRVERVLSPEQGGTISYKIQNWTTTSIKISGNAQDGSDLPRAFDRIRVSYYLDRLQSVTGDLLTVSGSILTAPGCVVGSNVYEATSADIAGDIAELTDLYYVDSSGAGHTLTAQSISGNRIYLQSPYPDLTGALCYASYLFAQPEKVIVGELSIREEKEKQWTTIPQGTVKLGLMPWWDLAQGDLVTLLGPEYVRDEVLTKSRESYDRLHEFDVTRVESDIVSENGDEYKLDVDFTVMPRRILKWIGRQPAPGSLFTVRYLYRPTYAIFNDNPIPAYMQNKRFPKTVTAALYSMLSQNEPAMKNQFSRYPVPQAASTPFDFVAQYSQGPRV
jgi:hypothetical protein